MTTLEWERQILNSMDLNDPRILEQSKKVDKLIMEVLREGNNHWLNETRSKI